MPVWREVKPTASSRAKTAGMPSMRTLRSWTCWRVVMSAKPAPSSCVISASVCTCCAVAIPFVMRMRIMKKPGVCLRKKTPYHFMSALSRSLIESGPSRL